MTVKPACNALLIAAIVCGLSAPVFAGPPSHAPAYGFYKNKDKNKDQHEQEQAAVKVEYHDNAGLPPTLQCEHTGAQTGAVVGGILGGVLGSKIGKGKGKTLATIAGTLIGGYLGKSVGTGMDSGDQRCAGETFEIARDQQTVEWVNPDTRNSYSVTPVSRYQDQRGQTCRSYTSEVIIDGQSHTRAGTACRQENGAWSIVN